MAEDDAECGPILPATGAVFVFRVVLKTLQTFQVMDEQARAAQPEALLAEWLREPDRNRAAPLLDSLVSQFAQPLIRRIVGFKLASAGTRGGARIQTADIEDISSNALYQLLARIQRMKNEEPESPVRNFSGYVAVTAYNACNEYFRSRKPAWLSLSMKLRYLLTHSPQLALWDTNDGREACGFMHMRGRDPETAPAHEIQIKLRESAIPGRLNTVQLAEAILRAAAKPLAFDVFVEIAVDCSGLKEKQVSSLEEDREDADPGVEAKLVGLAYVERLWAEICALPLQHRKCLLLNLNDGAGGDIQLFVHLGIASLEQIANSLEMSPIDFAKLWNDLPLDDLRIARELGISRQDVANRRSSARKRLIRRMKETS